ASL
ncbi:sugar (Glycoside-Pentoside-Hexuronide) transporter domain protein, partial [Vibrio parahaemolyticus V-223/04]